MAVEDAVSSSIPTVTVTDASSSLPVLPVIANPAAFSSMLTVSSPAMVSRLRASVPLGSTVTVVVAVPSL